MEFHPYREILTDSNIEVYFQFLQDIHEMRVPLNSLNTTGL